VVERRPNFRCSLFLKGTIFSVVYENKLWVGGGISGDLYYFNDVWNSSDGINWTEVTSNAHFLKEIFTHLNSV
jgi:hypothetical protein